jgi:TolA-binding protein
MAESVVTLMAISFSKSRLTFLHAPDNAWSAAQEATASGHRFDVGKIASGMLRASRHRVVRTAGIACLALFGLVSVALAQDTEPPVAPPAFTPATPPQAQPVDQPPVAPPVAPTEPPVAQPVSPAPADATTDAAPVVPIVVVPAPAEERFNNAMASFNAKQYADAVVALSDFVRDFPQDRRREEALFRLAESYRFLGHSDDALAAYTFQVQNYPDGPLRVNAELKRGAILFDAGKFTDAIEPLQWVADKGDGDLQQAAKYFLGRALLVTQKEAEGRAQLQALVGQNPTGKFAGGAAQSLAELDDTQKNYGEAAKLWQAAVTLSPNPRDKATAAARGGWSALQAKQPETAEKLFQAARQFDATGDARKVANTGLLRLLFQQKRYSEWGQIYTMEKDKLLDSARSEVLYDLGHAQFALKHWPEAVAGFDQYLAAFGTESSAVTAAYERFLALAQITPEKTAGEAEAYLKAWPKSPYRPRVRLLQAQELSREKKFTEALPLWENLAVVNGEDSWPHQDILLELARTYDELGNFPKAATAYQAYLDDLSAHPNTDKTVQAQRVLRAQARLALCLQKSDQLLAATEAWKAVQADAPGGSPEQETALESLGLIYARGGPAQEGDMVATFRALLDKFPNSPLNALAAFSVGDSLFKMRHYGDAESFFLKARLGDAPTWRQPATQRLVLGAYGQKDYDKTVAYVKEYDPIPPPADPVAAHAALLPASIFYWLGQTAQKASNWSDAETYYARFLQNPDDANLIWSGWWNLGQVQGQRKEWAAAVASYQKCRDSHAPQAGGAESTDLLLAMGRAELGAKNTDAAKKLGDEALLQEPEGPRSASARMLLGETAFAAQNYPEAARMFATLAVLFDDPKITPQAIYRAADSFEHAGDAKSAVDWRQKLSDKYPQFQPVPYL